MFLRKESDTINGDRSSSVDSTTLKNKYKKYIF